LIDHVMNRDDLLRRARGALVGVAIGDAMGAPVEGRSAAEIRAQHGRVTGFLSEDAAGTDDTDFTLFNATLLATYGSAITVEQVEAEWRDKLLVHLRGNAFLVTWSTDDRYRSTETVWRFD